MKHAKNPAVEAVDGDSLEAAADGVAVEAAGATSWSLGR